MLYEDTKTAAICEYIPLNEEDEKQEFLIPSSIEYNSEKYIISDILK